MNKAELVSAVAENTGFSKKDTEKLISATVDAITEELVAGGKVSLVGFGSFDVKDRPARLGHDPRTGREFEIEATRVPFFKPGKALKDSVAK